MKNVQWKSIGFAAVLGVCGAARAQITYSSSPGLAIPDNPTVSDTISVSGGTNAITGLTVRINLTHTWDADLDIALVHNGQYILLSTDNGSSGDNYTNTVFDDAAATSVTAGTAPFTGSFKPEGGTAAANGWAGTPTPPAAGAALTNLAGFLGQDANGPWQLMIDDDAAGDTGTLIDWSITVSGSIGGPTPPFGAWNANPNSVSNCGGQTSLFTVTVTPGTLPASTGITVTGDLTQVGGSATQTFFDNASNGDVTAGDNVFSYLVTIPNSVVSGSKSIPFTVADAQARSTNGTGSLSVVQCGETCAGAVPVGVGTVSYNTSGSVSDATTTCGGSGPDIFYVFTPSASGPYQIDTCGSSFDTVIGIFSSCGGTQLACNDNDTTHCTSGTLQSAVIMNLVSGTPYIIQVDGFAGANGAGVLNIGLATIPLGVAGNAVTAQETTAALLRATVTPGNPPLSSGITVTGDLSSIGGSASQTFYDNGTNGDVTAGDNIFSYSYTLPLSVTTAAYSIPVNAADAQSRTAAGSIALTVSNGPSGACCTAGSCALGRQTVCVSGGGTWQGNGSSCGTGYTMTAGSNPFIDISTTGTLLATISNIDDGTQAQALPFPFNHLGNVYNSVNVSSNGNLQFGASNSTAFTNVPIPDAAVPNDMLAPLWDDFDMVDTRNGPGLGGCYYLDDSATNNRVIFSWQGVGQYNTANPVTDSNDFQVILYSNGNVEFRYGNVPTILTPQVAGDTVTIGYEDSAGATGGEFPGASVGSGNMSISLTPVSTNPCGPSCDSIDFNNDTLFPDTADIDDFLSVFSGGPCSTDPTPGCNDVDFNNDTLFPDTLDIDALLSVFSGGDCLV